MSTTKSTKDEGKLSGGPPRSQMSAEEMVVKLHAGIIPLYKSVYRRRENGEPDTPFSLSLDPRTISIIDLKRRELSAVIRYGGEVDIRGQLVVQKCDELVAVLSQLDQLSVEDTAPTSKFWSSRRAPPFPISSTSQQHHTPKSPAFPSSISSTSLGSLSFPPISTSSSSSSSASSITPSSSSSSSTSNAIPFTLTLFPRLRALRLNDCAPSAVRGLSQLRATLDLLITSITLSSLEALLVTCLADAIDPDQQHWQSLRFLSCRFAGLADLSPALSMAPLLETLDISTNNVTTLDNIQYCPQLKHLHAGFNQITPSALTNIHLYAPQLVSLHLPSNDLRSLSHIRWLHSLRRLDLSNNHLSSMAEVWMLRELPCLEHLSLRGNPLAQRKGYRSNVLAVFYERWSDEQPGTIYPMPLRPTCYVIDPSARIITFTEHDQLIDGSEGQDIQPFIGPPFALEDSTKSSRRPQIYNTSTSNSGGTTKPKLAFVLDDEVATPLEMAEAKVVSKKLREVIKKYASLLVRRMWITGRKVEYNRITYRRGDGAGGDAGDSVDGRGEAFMDQKNNEKKNEVMKDSSKAQGKEEGKGIGKEGILMVSSTSRPFAFDSDISASLYGCPLSEFDQCFIGTPAYHSFVPSSILSSSSSSSTPSSSLATSSPMAGQAHEGDGSIVVGKGGKKRKARIAMITEVDALSPIRGAPDPNTLTSSSSSSSLLTSSSSSSVGGLVEDTSLLYPSSSFLGLASSISSPTSTAPSSSASTTVSTTVNPTGGTSAVSTFLDPASLVLPTRRRRDGEAKLKPHGKNTLNQTSTPKHERTLSGSDSIPNRLNTPDPTIGPSSTNSSQQSLPPHSASPDTHTSTSTSNTSQHSSNTDPSTSLATGHPPHLSASLLPLPRSPTDPDHTFALDTSSTERSFVTEKLPLRRAASKPLRTVSDSTAAAGYRIAPFVLFPTSSPSPNPATTTPDAPPRSINTNTDRDRPLVSSTTTTTTTTANADTPCRPSSASPVHSAVPGLISLGSRAILQEILDADSRSSTPLLRDAYMERSQEHPKDGFDRHSSSAPSPTSTSRSVASTHFLPISATSIPHPTSTPTGSIPSSSSSSTTQGPAITHPPDWLLEASISSTSIGLTPADLLGPRGLTLFSKDPPSSSLPHSVQVLLHSTQATLSEDKGHTGPDTTASLPTDQLCMSPPSTALGPIDASDIALVGRYIRDFESSPRLRGRQSIGCIDDVSHGDGRGGAVYPVRTTELVSVSLVGTEKYSSPPLLTSSSSSSSTSSAVKAYSPQVKHSSPLATPLPLRLGLPYDSEIKQLVITSTDVMAVRHILPRNSQQRREADSSSRSTNSPSTSTSTPCILSIDIKGVRELDINTGCVLGDSSLPLVPTPITSSPLPLTTDQSQFIVISASATSSTLVILAAPRISSLVTSLFTPAYLASCLRPEEITSILTSSLGKHVLVKAAHGDEPAALAALTTATSSPADMLSPSRRASTAAAIVRSSSTVHHSASKLTASSHTPSSSTSSGQHTTTPRQQLSGITRSLSLLTRDQTSPSNHSITSPKPTPTPSSLFVRSRSSISKNTLNRSTLETALTTPITPRGDTNTSASTHPMTESTEADAALGASALALSREISAALRTLPISSFSLSPQSLQSLALRQGGFIAQYNTGSDEDASEAADVIQHIIRMQFLNVLAAYVVLRAATTSISSPSFASLVAPLPFTSPSSSGHFTQQISVSPLPCLIQQPPGLAPSSLSLPPKTVTPSSTSTDPTLAPPSEESTLPSPSPPLATDLELDYVDVSFPSLAELLDTTSLPPLCPLPLSTTKHLKHLKHLVSYPNGHHTSTQVKGGPSIRTPLALLSPSNSSASRTNPMGLTLSTTLLPEQLTEPFSIPPGHPVQPLVAYRATSHQPIVTLDSPAYIIESYFETDPAIRAANIINSLLIAPATSTPNGPNQDIYQTNNECGNEAHSEVTSTNASQIRLEDPLLVCLCRVYDDVTATQTQRDRIARHVLAVGERAQPTSIADIIEQMAKVEAETWKQAYTSAVSMLMFEPCSLAENNQSGSSQHGQGISSLGHGLAQSSLVISPTFNAQDPSTLLTLAHGDSPLLSTTPQTVSIGPLAVVGAGKPDWLRTLLRENPSVPDLTISPLFAVPDAPSPMSLELARAQCRFYYPPPTRPGRVPSLTATAFSELSRFYTSLRPSSHAPAIVNADLLSSIAPLTASTPFLPSQTDSDNPLTRTPARPTSSSQQHYAARKASVPSLFTSSETLAPSPSPSPSPSIAKRRSTLPYLTGLSQPTPPPSSPFQAPHDTSSSSSSSSSLPSHRLPHPICLATTEPARAILPLSGQSWHAEFPSLVVLTASLVHIFVRVPDHVYSSAVVRHLGPLAHAYLSSPYAPPSLPGCHNLSTNTPSTSPNTNFSLPRDATQVDRLIPLATYPITSLRRIVLGFSLEHIRLEFIIPGHPQYVGISPSPTSTSSVSSTLHPPTPKGSSTPSQAMTGPPSTPTPTLVRQGSSYLDTDLLGSDILSSLDHAPSLIRMPSTITASPTIGDSSTMYASTTVPTSDTSMSVPHVRGPARISSHIILTRDRALSHRLVSLLTEAVQRAATIRANKGSSAEDHVNTRSATETPIQESGKVCSQDIPTVLGQEILVKATQVQPLDIPSNNEKERTLTDEHPLETSLLLSRHLGDDVSDNTSTLSADSLPNLTSKKTQGGLAGLLTKRSTTSQQNTPHSDVSRGDSARNTLLRRDISNTHTSSSLKQDVELYIANEDADMISRLNKEVLYDTPGATIRMYACVLASVHTITVNLDHPSLTNPTSMSRLISMPRSDTSARDDEGKHHAATTSASGIAPALMCSPDHLSGYHSSTTQSDTRPNAPPTRQIAMPGHHAPSLLDRREVARQLRWADNTPSHPDLSHPTKTPLGQQTQDRYAPGSFLNPQFLLSPHLSVSVGTEGSDGSEQACDTYSTLERERDDESVVESVTKYEVPLPSRLGQGGSVDTSKQGSLTTSLPSSLQIPVKKGSPPLTPTPGASPSLAFKSSSGEVEPVFRARTLVITDGVLHMCIEDFSVFDHTPAVLLDTVTEKTGALLSPPKPEGTSKTDWQSIASYPQSPQVSVPTSSPQLSKKEQKDRAKLASQVHSAATTAATAQQEWEKQSIATQSKRLTANKRFHRLTSEPLSSLIRVMLTPVSSQAFTSPTSTMTTGSNDPSYAGTITPLTSPKHLTPSRSFFRGFGMDPTSVGGGGTVSVHFSGPGGVGVAEHRDQQHQPAAGAGATGSAASSLSLVDMVLIFGRKEAFSTVVNDARIWTLRMSKEEAAKIRQLLSTTTNI